jgi:hypothetical protein
MFSEECVEGNLVIELGFFTGSDLIKSLLEFFVVVEEVVW